MRKRLKIIIPVVIVLFISFMAYKIYAKIAQQQQIAQQIRTIPEFYFYRIDTVKTHGRASQPADKIFKNTDLAQNKATLIINFHPECGHFTYEAEVESYQVESCELLSIPDIV